MPAAAVSQAITALRQDLGDQLITRSLPQQAPARLPARQASPA
jgi:DNA-binding transcriptional LysR family regulator